MKTKSEGALSANEKRLRKYYADRAALFTRRAQLQRRLKLAISHADFNKASAEVARLGKKVNALTDRIAAAKAKQ